MPNKTTLVMAQGVLAAGMSSGDLALTLAAGQGARFEALGAGETVNLVIVDENESIFDRFEVVTATARVGDVLTITRAKEGTTAKQFPITPGNPVAKVRVFQGTTPENIKGMLTALLLLSPTITTPNITTPAITGGNIAGPTITGNVPGNPDLTEGVKVKGWPIVGNIPFMNLAYFPVGATSFATTAVDVGTERIILAAHGYKDGQEIRFSSTGAYPGGITGGATPYYIVGAVAGSFQLSLTPGGAALNLTSQGTGTHTITPQFRVPAGVTRAYVRMAGGGGGGSGSNGYDVSSHPGAYGAYAEGYVTVVPGEIIAVPLGQGGAGGGLYAPGNPGSGTVFKTLTAGGGGGGLYNSYAAPTAGVAERTGGDTEPFIPGAGGTVQSGLLYGFGAGGAGSTTVSGGAGSTGKPGALIIHY